MKSKLLIPLMPLRAGRVNGQDGVKLARFYSDNGADGIVIFDLSDTEEEHEENIGRIKEIAGVSELPVYAGGHIRREEDVKKILYAGCSKAILNFGRESNVEMEAATMPETHLLDKTLMTAASVAAVLTLITGSSPL